MTKKKESEIEDVSEVLKAITAVTKGLGKAGIAKEGKNKQQNYSFRGIDQVYQALSPLLVEHGLIITPRVLSRDIAERTSKGGGALFFTCLEVEFTFRSSVDGSEIVTSTFGEGMDSADKSTNKALSSAYKYLVFLTFCVPLKGEPDADEDHHEVEPTKPKVGEEIKSFEEVKADISKCGSFNHLKNIYNKYYPIFEGEEKAELVRLKDIRKEELEGSK